MELTGGWEPEAKVYYRLEYVDPGEYIEAIICPRCGMRLKMDWLPEDEPYYGWYGDIVQQEQEEGAESLQVVTPCCKQSVPFKELQFIEGGFAMFELQVSNPEIDYPMPAEMQSKVEAILGCRVTQIWARY